MPDRLHAMNAFVTVADLSGFAPAARRLDVAPSVVTRLVAGLENALGVRLLQRTTRSVRLTDAGARYLERARRILAEVEEAERSAQDERASPSGRIVVAAPLLFGRLHVRPLVSRFLADHPATTADLRLSDRAENLVEDGIDVSVRIGHLPDSGLIARRLGETRRILVASPGFLRAQAEPITEPSDLPHYDLAAFSGIGVTDRWRFRKPGGKEFAVAIGPRFATNNGDAAIEHAIGGGGITAAFSYQVAAALQDGTLVEILPDYAPQPVPISAVFPTSRLLSANVRAFLDLAQDAASGWTFAARAR